MNFKNGIVEDLVDDTHTEYDRSKKKKKTPITSNKQTVSFFQYHTVKIPRGVLFHFLNFIKMYIGYYER